MKKTFRLLTALTLCAAMAIGLMPTLASAAPAGVSSYTDTIGKKTVTIVSVTMNKNRQGKIILAGDSVVQDDAAANLIAKANNQEGAVAAAINGGFFNSYYNAKQPLAFPDNCAQIYNTIIQDGKLVNAGGAKPVIGFDGKGGVLIDKVGFRPTMKYAKSGFTAQAWGVNYNYPNEPEAIMIFTDEMTLPVSIPASSSMIYVKDGVVTDITSGGQLTVPKGTDVIVYNSAVASIEKGHQRFPSVGEKVTISYVSSPRDASKTAQWNNMDVVIGGGSILLLDGQIVTDQNPEFTEAKQQPDFVAQRSFVALTYSGTLLMGTVNASFNQIAAYLQGQNVKDAMAMDGGASSMLYVGGEGFKYPAGRKLASILAIVDKGFTDVPDWCAEPVDWAVEKKVTDGTSASTFSPNETCTQAHILTFLWRAMGKPSPRGANPYSNIKGDEYYAQAATWAHEKGLIGDAFDPSAPCTRAQTVTYLWQLANKPSAPKAAFDDVDDSAAYAKAVNWAVKAKVTDGTSPSTFEPSATCTRGQIVTFLYRALAK